MLSTSSSASSLPTLPAIDLLRSSPSPRLLPAASIAYAARQVLTDPFSYASALLYGPDLGSTPLRHELAAWLSESYDTAVTVDRICITGGASLSLSQVLQKFTDPVWTASVVVVKPADKGRVRMFGDQGLEDKVRFLEEGSEGIDCSKLEETLGSMEHDAMRRGDVAPRFKSPSTYPKLYRHIIYLMPTFKNPTGKTISVAVRQRLVELARRFNALIVSDDAFDFLRWTTGNGGWSRPLPRLVDIDKSMGIAQDGFGNVVSNGSFSKLVAPGCRVGWIEGTEMFVKALSEVGSTIAGGAPSQLVSTFVWNLLTTGTLTSHLDNVLLPVFARRYGTLISAVTAGLLPLGITLCDHTYTCPFSGSTVVGGWFLWVKLPAWCRGEKLVHRLRDEQNVMVGWGAEEFDYGDRSRARGARQGSLAGILDAPEGEIAGEGSEYLRICWAWEEEEKLKEGVRRITETLKALGASNVY